MPVTPTPVWIIPRVLIGCSVPGCRVTYSWLGPKHIASDDARLEDLAAAHEGALAIGWRFRDSGDLCPRHSKGAPDARNAAR